MPLVLHPAVEADAPRIVEVEFLAYASNALSPILFPGPPAPDGKEKRAEGMIAELRENPTVRWMKVVDTDTNELCAFAKWDIMQTPKQTPGTTRQFGPGCNVEACQEFFGGIHRRRNELMGGKAYCLLDLLHTDPKYQGRGAAGMLVKWGCDIADELHLPAYLEASPAGHRLYQKNGFRDIDELFMDPKWNAPATPCIYFMIRAAK